MSDIPLNISSDDAAIFQANSTMDLYKDSSGTGDDPGGKGKPREEMFRARPSRPPKKYAPLPTGEVPEPHPWIRILPRAPFP